MDEFNWKAYDSWNNKLIEKHAPKEDDEPMTKEEIAATKADEKWDQDHGK